MFPRRGAAALLLARTSGLLYFLVLIGILIRAELLPASFGISAATVESSFLELAHSGELAIHVVSSCYRVGTGWLIGALAALVFALLTSSSRLLYNLVVPCFDFLRMISPLAWIPFLIFLAGLGDIPAIILVAISTFFPVFGVTLYEAKNLDPYYAMIARNLCYSRAAIIVRVILPATLPTFFNGTRAAFGIAWYVVIAAEMLGAQEGLGYLISVSRLTLALDKVVVAIIFIGTLGVILSTILDLAMLRLFPWKEHAS